MADKEDNLLLEWVVMLVLKHAGRLRRICPIMFGAALSQGPHPFSSLFATPGGPSTLPQLVPTATIAKAKEALRKMSVAIPPELRLDEWTVHLIVEKICKMNGVLAWQVPVPAGHGTSVHVQADAKHAVMTGIRDKLMQCLAD